MKAKANLVLLSEKVDQEDSGWESVYEDNDINVNTKLRFSCSYYAWRFARNKAFCDEMNNDDIRRYKFNSCWLFLLQFTILIVRLVLKQLNLI